ncbi:MAG TPA: hypothetical protein VGN79_05955 [Devosia sp.]|jgi:DNA repair exonuclease SbcCD ATPase subunit|nr:hypothetical protein [Devosia sp.]
MVIENIMYFALGLFAAALMALIIMPAVWKRAVRLTKRRIEAATPITMAEFRADKDQLRAEFALTTRRLEMTIDGLRKRLAEELSDYNQKRAEAGMFKAENQRLVSIVADLEARGEDLRIRVQELERENTDFAQRLRMRERDLETRTAELQSLREALRGDLPQGTEPGGTVLSGDYDEDVDRLTTTLAIERKRAAFLEEQANSLLARLETSDRRSAEATAAIAQMRAALAKRSDGNDIDADELAAAEARIASAESRLNALLDESRPVSDAGETETQPGLLADELSAEDDLDAVRKKVATVEASILADWGTEKISEDQLREQLRDIAAGVTRIVYSADVQPTSAPSDESLFDRIQRFADDGPENQTEAKQDDVPAPDRSGAVSDRMTALREIQSR